MAQETKNAADASSQPLTEAERMSRIRELLVAPVVADESVRVNRTVERLDGSLAAHANELATLASRLDLLEADHLAAIQTLNLRLLGVVEALLCGDAELRRRVQDNPALRDRLKVTLVDQINGAPAKS